MKRFTSQMIRLAFQLSTMRLLSASALGLLVACSGCDSAYAQAVYGSIIGTVTDNTGAVVPNATVKI